MNRCAECGMPMPNMAANRKYCDACGTERRRVQARDSARRARARKAPGGCRHCGKPITKGRHKYCSALCMQRANRLRGKNTQKRHCDYCGKLCKRWLPGRKAGWLCSGECWELYVAYEQSSVFSKRERNKRVKQRKCLGCSEMFWSSGPANRICSRCKRVEDLGRKRPGERRLTDDTARVFDDDL